MITIDDDAMDDDRVERELFAARANALPAPALSLADVIARAESRTTRGRIARIANTSRAVFRGRSERDADGPRRDSGERRSMREALVAVLAAAACVAGVMGLASGARAQRVAHVQHVTAATRDPGTTEPVASFAETGALACTADVSSFFASGDADRAGGELASLDDRVCKDDSAIAACVANVSRECDRDVTCALATP